MFLEGSRGPDISRNIFSALLYPSRGVPFTVKGCVAQVLHNLKINHTPHSNNLQHSGDSARLSVFLVWLKVPYS